MGWFSSFALSYAANNVPTIAKMVGANKSLEDEMEKCYQRALKRWCKNDGIRGSMSLRMFRNLESLKKYLQRKEHIDESELIELWADEMRNSEKCYHYIQETKLDTIIDDTQNNTILLQKLDNRTEEILQKVSYEKTFTPKRGLWKHHEVKGYIRRYCTDERDANDFLRYLLKKQDRHTLADYITNDLTEGKTKFVLYSGAQTGKTTELENLCWELQESGLFLPVSYEVKSSYDLKQYEMPFKRWVDGKEVVVVIDALDEINGKDREDLLKVINSYAHDNPDMKMVLSCRSNYRRDDQLSRFHELYIENLSGEDARTHIDGQLGKRNNLWNYLVENNLTEFAKQPFYLNVLIKAAKKEKRLPHNRTEIYRLFIEYSYDTEKYEKGTLSEYRATSDELMEMLEHLAVAISLMNRQSLSERDFNSVLGNDRQKIEECKRCPIIKKASEEISFDHNAFREWLTATYLYKQGLEKAKLFATQPNGKIKPEWYNIIMLWTSMYTKEEAEKITGIIEWLKLASLDLVIYSDVSLLDDNKRSEIFINIVEEYKNLGIRMSNIMMDDYRDMLRFGQTPQTVEYIADELAQAKPGTAIYADMMCMCYFLNWTLAEQTSQKAFDKLLGVLDGITIKNLKEKPTGDLTYLHLGNVFFYKKNYVQKYYEVFKDSVNYDAIKVMVSLIHRSGLADEYIDYILDKEKYVVDQHEGNTTHVVSRDEIYVALSTVESADGIRKIIGHPFKNNFYYSDSEWRCYKDMMATLLQKAARLIRRGIYKELVEDMERSYLRIYPDQYHQTGAHQDLLVAFRDSYAEAGGVENAKTAFDSFIATLFNGDSERNEIKEEYAKVGLWMTKEMLDGYYSTFDPNSDKDKWVAERLQYCPYLDLASYARQKYGDFFPESEIARKSRERQQNRFNELADYQVFLSQVLEMLGKCASESRKGLKQILDESDINVWTSYPYQFICHYLDEDGYYSRDVIIKSIKDRHVYDAFFMTMVKAVSKMAMHTYVLDEASKKRQNDTAKIIVESIAVGKHYDWCYEETALQLMMEGGFDVDEDTLIALLPYSPVSISKKNRNGFGETYRLFDYIVEHVDEGKLSGAVVKLLRNLNLSKDASIVSRIADYIIYNHISDGYPILFDFIVEGNQHADYITEIMLKGRVMVEEIKAVSDKLNTSHQIIIYNTLCRELGEEDWVRTQLEARYQGYEGYYLELALRILLSIGSIGALEYMVAHPELLVDEREYNFNFTDINATGLLFEVLEMCHKNQYNHDILNTSIITSLGKIATQSEEALNEVKRKVKEQIGKDVYYKYLNRYIIQYENSYYESIEPPMSIEKVIEMMEERKPIGEVEAEVHVPSPVYISYNWEKKSDYTVNHLCEVLRLNGIEYKRDKEDCHYTDNIKEFMESIRNGDLIVVVLSREYLLSKNCMFELSGILEKKGGKDKILPVVTDDSIRSRRFFIDLVKHWKEAKETLLDEMKELKEIDPDMATPFEEEYSEMEVIYGSLKDLKDYIDWVNADSLNNMKSTNFKVVLDKIRSCER